MPFPHIKFLSHPHQQSLTLVNRLSDEKQEMSLAVFLRISEGLTSSLILMSSLLWSDSSDSLNPFIFSPSSSFSGGFDGSDGPVLISVWAKEEGLTKFIGAQDLCMHKSRWWYCDIPSNKEWSSMRLRPKQIFKWIGQTWRSENKRTSKQEMMDNQHSTIHYSAPT